MAGYQRARRLLTTFVVVLVIFSLACSLPLPGRQPTPTVEAPAGPVPAGPQPTATPPPNPLPPALLETDPLPGAEIPLSGAITLRFNQPMERASVEAALRNSASLAGSFSWVNDATVSFQPAAPLPPAQELTITIDTAAQSKKGLKMLSPVDVTFQTAGFLNLAQTLPEDGTGDVNPASAVVASFNRPVVPLGADPASLPEAFTLEPAVAGKGEWVNTSTYIFKPDISLGGGMTYSVRLNPGLQSTDGGPLEGSRTEWSFTVALPYPLSFEPADTQLEARLDQPVKIVFNQSMDPERTQANFNLLDEQLQPVSGEFGWDAKYTTLWFTPTQLLQRNATYITQLLPGAASFGGMPLDVSYQAAWQTVPTLFVTFTEPPSGGTTGAYTGVSLNFSSYLPQGDMEPFFSITPPVTNAYYNLDYTGKSVYINGDFLPETEYTVRVDSSLRDRWGENLREPYQFDFTTAPLDPNLYIPLGQEFIFMTPQDTALPVQVSNMSEVPIELGSVPLVDFLVMTGNEGYTARQQYFPADVASWTYRADVPGDETRAVALPLSPSGGGLEPGIYHLRFPLSNLFAGPYVIVVSNIQVTYKVSAMDAFVWALDLRSDSPAAGLPVTIYTADGRSLANGQTDAQGVFHTPIPIQEDRYQPTMAVVGLPETDNFGLALSSWDQMISPYNFGVSYASTPPHLEAYIYTERPIYRPGQTVFYRAIARWVENGRYSPPQAISLVVKLYDGVGTLLKEEELPLSAMGAVHGEFTLSPNAQPGYYRLEVGENSLTFVVAEYRKPEINVSLALAADQLHYGDDLQATVNAQYFFGAPASGVQVNWYLYAARDSFYLPGYQVGGENRSWLQAFRFGDFGGLGSLVAQGSDMTGPDGALSLSVSTIPETYSYKDESNPLNYTLEVTLTDESGLPVSTRASALVHPGDVYIGLQPDAWVAQAGKETGYQVQVVDWQASAAGQQALRAEYRKVTWKWERPDQRYNIPEPVAEYTSVASVDFTTGDDGMARLAFTPPEPGTYEPVVMSGKARTVLTQWVGGPGQPVWPNLPNQRLQLTADREGYAPGDTAQVFIPNPFGEPAQMLVTLERSVVMQHQVLSLPADGLSLPVELTEEHAPNVYVSVLVIGRTQRGTPDFRLGYINLDVEPIQFKLNVSLAVQPQVAGPGDSVTVQMKVTDSSGAPVQGEFSLSVVDLAVLKLMDPFARDIVPEFYGRQLLGVHTSMALAAYGGRDIFVPGGLGGGGGGEDISPVREDFPDTAYWNPSLLTDANGEASVTLSLPDSLTTWELDLRGITADNRVGQSRFWLVTTQDLLIRPVTPRFLVVGDHTQLAAVVQNNTASELQVEVGLQSDGMILDGAASQTINVPANGRTRVEWWGTVQDIEALDLVFTARGGGLEDAARPANGALPVLRYRAAQSFATAGVLEAAGERLELVSLPPNVDTSAGARAGGLQLQLSPSLGAAAYEALDVLNNYPYDCTEQVASRLLGNLATLQAARTANLSDANLFAELERQVQDGVSILSYRQSYDGGWGWWASETSDAHITAYAILALDKARSAGFAINDEALRRAGEYLAASLLQPEQGSAGWEWDRWAFAQYALMLAGSSNPDAPSTLYAERARLSPWAQALTVLLLESTSPSSAEAATLLSDLEAAALRSASGAHWEDSNAGFRSMASSISTTAIAAYTLVRHKPESTLLPDAIRFLMVSRQAGGAWASTYDSAWVLTALNEYVSLTGELGGSYAYGASLNGVSIADSQAGGVGGLQSEEINIPLGRLYPNDPNALAVQRGDGPGRLYYTAVLDVSRPVAEVAPLNRGLVVSRRYYLPGQADPVTAAQAGQQVTVRVQLVVPEDAFFVVVEDYIPAGAEVLNSSLKTVQQGYDEFGNPVEPGPVFDLANPFSEGWGWWLFGAPQIYDDRIAWTASFLSAGTYELTYRITTLQAGNYHVLPVRAYQFYFPDVQGNGAGAVFEILP